MIEAGALALLSVYPAGAQSLATSQSPANLTAPANSSDVLACEAQMRRMTGSNKTLAANFNTTRVHNHCVATVREAVANK